MQDISHNAVSVQGASGCAEIVGLPVTALAGNLLVRPRLPPTPAWADKRGVVSPSGTQARAATKDGADTSFLSRNVQAQVAYRYTDLSSQLVAGPYETPFAWAFVRRVAFAAGSASVTCRADSRGPSQISCREPIGRQMGRGTHERELPSADNPQLPHDRTPR